VSIPGDAGSLPSEACPPDRRRNEIFVAGQGPLGPEYDFHQFIGIDVTTNTQATEYCPADLVERRYYFVLPGEEGQKWAQEHGIPQPPAAVCPAVASAREASHLSMQKASEIETISAGQVSGSVPPVNPQTSFSQVKPDPPQSSSFTHSGWQVPVAMSHCWLPGQCALSKQCSLTTQPVTLESAARQAIAIVDGVLMATYSATKRTAEPTAPMHQSVTS